MLTGLIVAGENAGDRLRAELPIAGQTVFEHQARLLFEAGAARVILVAEQLPEGLSAAAARLRRDGIAIEIARQTVDLAQLVQPDERLLLLGDGVVPDSVAIERMQAAPAPAVMAIPAMAEGQGFELIDAASRWAGLMLVDGELVRRTARMLGDWDLPSTLLRNAVQAGAERTPMPRATILARADSQAAAQAIEQAISRAAGRRHRGVLDRYLFDPLARLVAPRAMGAMLDPGWIRGGAAGLLVLAALLFLTDWRALGLALALLSGPLDTLGRHLGVLSMRLRRDAGFWSRMRLAGGALALVALGWNLRGEGWGVVTLAAATLGFMAALHQHERWIGRPAPRPLWLAEPDALIWLVLPFALAGWWPAGLAAQAVYAFGSLLAVQRLTRRQP